MVGLFYFSLALFTIVIAAPVQAEEGFTLTVDPTDTPLVITGRLDDNSTTFTGNVRLTLAGSETANIQLLASDLIHDSNPDWDIARSHVTMPTGLMFNDMQPRDVPITVSSVAHPGTYSGELHFLLPGQALEDGLLVPLQLQVTAIPQVAAVEPTLSLQLVRCGHPVSCWWAARFVGPAATNDNWQLYVHNETEEPVRLESGTVVLRGQNSADTVRSDDLQLALPLQIPASQIEPVEMVIQRQHLAPDRYEGTVRLHVAGATAPLVMTLSLDVRNGPLWPLVIILLGILVGRLARGMNSELAQLQRELIPTFQNVWAQAYKLNNERSRQHLLDALQRFKQALDRGSQPAATLWQKLEQLQHMAAFLQELEILLANQPSYMRERVREQVDAVWRALQAGDEAEAQQQYQALQEQLASQLGDSIVPTQLSALQQRFAAIWDMMEQRTVSAFYRLLAAVSGIRVSAGMNFWVLRPLLWGVLLIILTLVGMQTLYVNSGASFGASGINDYLGLFLWGLTGDVASATLANWQSSQYG